MARTKGVNLSEEIRAYIRKNKKAGNSEVVKGLSASGVNVSPTLVAGVRSRMKGKKGAKATRGGKRRGRPGRKPGKASNGMLPGLDALLDAKKLADQMGSIDAVRRALDAIEKLS
jgi:hypothetical protein